MLKPMVALGLLLATSATIAAAQAPDGKAIYDANCKKCHGPTGIPLKGIKTMSPKIMNFDAAFFKTRTDEDLVSQITTGKDKMKSFKTILKPDEIEAVAQYIRTLGK